MEFERKFKINSLSDTENLQDLTFLSNSYISQYYLANRECDLRVRCQKNLKTNLTKFHLTLKSLDEGVFREEYNLEISAQEGKRLTNSSLVKSHIGKFRTSWQSTDHHICSIDVDIFSKNSNVIDPETNDTLIGLVEIEFPSRILAEEFVPYSWLGKEVTSDSRYRNLNLSSPRNQNTAANSFNKPTTDFSENSESLSADLWLSEDGYWCSDSTHMLKVNV